MTAGFFNVFIAFIHVARVSIFQKVNRRQHLMGWFSYDSWGVVSWGGSRQEQRWWSICLDRVHFHLLATVICGRMERCTNPVSLQLDGLVVEREVIGYGTFARVKRATWDGRPCAAKMLQEDREKSSKARYRFQNEGKLLSRLKHPNIVGLHSVSRDYKTGSDVLVLELLMQDLRMYLQERKSISFYQKVDLCCDIAYGLRYLHSSQPAVLHRHLSDKNILVSWSNRAKIANFSRAREFQPSNPPRPSQRRSSLGGLATSSPYMPPEVHGPHPHYGTKVDIFSCGVLALQIDTQKPPDPTPEPEDQSPNFAARSLCKPMSEIDRRWEHIRLLEADDPLRKLILQCLEDKPEHRPTTPDLCLLLEEAKGSWKYAEFSLEVSHKLK